MECLRVVIYRIQHKIYLHSFAAVMYGDIPVVKVLQCAMDKAILSSCRLTNCTTSPMPTVLSQLTVLAAFSFDHNETYRLLSLSGYFPNARCGLVSTLDHDPTLIRTFWHACNGNPQCTYVLLKLLARKSISLQRFHEEMSCQLAVNCLTITAG